MRNRSMSASLTAPRGTGQRGGVLHNGVKPFVTRLWCERMGQHPLDQLVGHAINPELVAGPRRAMRSLVQYRCEVHHDVLLGVRQAGRQPTQGWARLTRAGRRCTVLPAWSPYRPGLPYKPGLPYRPGLPTSLVSFRGLPGTLPGMRLFGQAEAGVDRSLPSARGADRLSLARPRRHGNGDHHKWLRAE